MALSKSFRRPAQVFLIAFVMLPFMLVPAAVAEDAEGVQPASEGWYFDRPKAQANPPEGSPPELGGAIDTVGDPFSNVGGQFAGDHLYVGWDPLDTQDRQEYFSGINFDLSQAGVPLEATITKFVITVLEHPESTEHNRPTSVSPDEARGDFNTETGEGSTRVVACPFPEFAAGTPGQARSEAPPIRCDQGKVTASSIATQRFYPSESVFAWTFDITQIMNDLYEKASTGDAFTSIALVADIDNPSNSSWVTTFHGGGYGRETSPGQFTPEPGVMASISWSSSTLIGDLFDEDFEDFSATTDFGGDSGGFTDFSGEEVPAEPAEPVESEPAPVAGVFRSNSVPFWQIPLAGWVAALLGAMGIGFAGWLLTGGAVDERRPPGAVSTMMSRAQSTG